MTTLTVITATRNCAGALPRLVGSLESQTDRDFEWVVADGASDDDTLRVAERCTLPRKRIDSRPDFGIYDALNRGVKLASGDFYLVAGADDTLDPRAIAGFRLAASSGADIVAASVRIRGAVVRPMQGALWRHGGNALVASHSVGTLIRRDLHARLGLYSNRFPHAADMHFIRLAQATRGVTFEVADFVAGEFATGGLTSTDYLGSLTEAFRIQLLFEKHAAPQYALHVARLLRVLMGKRSAF